MQWPAIGEIKTIRVCNCPLPQYDMANSVVNMYVHRLCKLCSHLASTTSPLIVYMSYCGDGGTCRCS